MTILHVITGLGMGGAERNLVQIATALRSRGLVQHVVCAKERGIWADELEACGIPVTVLNIRSTFTDVPGAVVQLVRLIRRLQPRLLQGWMYHGNVLAALAHRLCGGSGRRLFWNLRASNMDEDRYRRIMRWGARMSGWPEMVLANSQTGLDFHIAQGFHPRRAEVIPNGIDIDKFRPDPAARSRQRAALDIPDDAVVAIHVARLDPMKDHTTFLQGMAARPRMFGLLVGAGTEALSLPDNIRALGLRRDIEALYVCADVVVSTSAFGEGFSNILAEGMSSGLVPIATDVGDARLIIGKTGHLIPRRSPEMLAEALGIENARTTEERFSRGLNARARIVENFTIARAADRYEQLYAG